LAVLWAIVLELEYVFEIVMRASTRFCSSQ